VGLQTDATDLPGTRRRITEPLSGVLATNWIPLALVVCGLLTLARIIRIGAQMHDDLAGTI
jgi:hypothetical protein